MSYPSVYCVKCKSHTDTLARHTIQLSNSRRALKGVCPVCATETYRFMPEKGARETQLSLISSQHRLPLTQEKVKEKAKSALVSKFRPSSQGLSRMEFVHFSSADKMLNYGVLLILFGLSAIIGYVVCAELFLR